MNIGDVVKVKDNVVEVLGPNNVYASLLAGKEVKINELIDDNFVGVIHKGGTYCVGIKYLESIPPKLEWTKELPTKPGFYWMEEAVNKGAYLGAEIAERRSGLWLVVEPGTELRINDTDFSKVMWYGPVEVPMNDKWEK